MQRDLSQDAHRTVRNGIPFIQLIANLHFSSIPGLRASARDWTHATSAGSVVVLLDDLIGARHFLSSTAGRPNVDR
jgi:hypothetical protein